MIILPKTTIDNGNIARTLAGEPRIRNFASEVGRPCLHLLEMAAGLLILCLLDIHSSASSSFVSKLERGTKLYDRNSAYFYL